jgi:MFS family permease
MSCGHLTHWACSATAHVHLETVGAIQISDTSGSLANLFKKRHNRMAAMLAVGVSLFQQLGGINTIIFYSADILRACGIKSPIFATVLVGLVNLGMTVASAGLVDKYGRKVCGVFSSQAILGCRVVLQNGLFDT